MRAPNVFVLLFALLVVVGGLTWIVPAGRFDRATVETPIGERKVVVAGSYQRLPAEEAAPQGPAAILKAPFNGLVGAVEVVAFILLIGGAFGVLNKTGALIAALAWLAGRAGRRLRFAAIPLLMFAFSGGGALFGMSEEIIPLILVTVPLAIALGFDTITGVAIPLVAAQVGFAAAFVNPFTLGIAKGIAEVPYGGGEGYRMLCWLILTVVAIAGVTWHAARVARDPSRSPTPEIDAYWRTQQAGEAVRLSHRDVAVVVAFLAAMVLLALGAMRWGWYIPELIALFIAMALVCGAAGRLGPNQIGDAFADGIRDLAPTAVLVGLSRGILVLAEDGKIIDTALVAMAGTLDGLGPTFGLLAMFGIQSALNVFIPSGSGQAALTMPVMAPLSDLLGISRDNAVLAFQFGDGLTNLVIPTSYVLIGILSMARVPFGAWLRWMIPLQLVLMALGLLLLALSPL
jgi:uncharacterized ion transporter superfamily protein YfcC